VLEWWPLALLADGFILPQGHWANQFEAREKPELASCHAVDIFLIDFW
jgi:hypothetical protein